MHRDVKATVRRIHAAEFAAKSALKLAKEQGSRTQQAAHDEFFHERGVNVEAARASGHLPVSQSPLLTAFAKQAPPDQAPARPNHQSWQRAPLDRWCSHGSCRRPLRRSSTQYGQTLSTQLRCRSTCWTIHQFAQRSTPPPIWYAHSGHSACRIVPASIDVAGEERDAHEGREVHSTQPQAAR